MSGFIQCIALGRLGGDPEVSYTQGGTAVCKFSIATSRKEKDRDGNRTEKTTWTRWKAFGQQAELIGQHVRKGELLFVEGRPDQWEATGDRGKVTVTDYIVEHFEFCGARRDDDDEGGGPRSRGVPPRASSGYSPRRPAAPAQPNDGGGFDDDIPF